MSELSVIIPTFNRRALLQHAVDSALAIRALGLRVEVVVVDDCSTDDTWPWLESIRDEEFLALRTERNAGQCNARNLGLSRSNGTYLLFLDSDDVLEPEAIRQGVAALEESGAEIAVFGWGVMQLDGSGKSTRRQQYAASHFTNVVDGVLQGFGPATSAGLYRRTYVEGVQWDASLRKLDDWDWFCQAALQGGRIITLPLIAYWVRDHDGPRVTSQATMLLNAHEHHAILRKIEIDLRTKGELTERRRKRLAQYYYKELRVLSLHDRAAFEAAVVHIHELDPRFTPRDEERQWWMKVAAKVFGTRRTLLAHSALKRLVKGVP